MESFYICGLKVLYTRSSQRKKTPRMTQSDGDDPVGRGRNVYTVG